MWMHTDSGRFEFPSPCGDYGSSDTGDIVTNRARTTCFRPLAGITGLRTGEGEKPFNREVKVSVPLRGLRVFGRGGFKMSKKYFNTFPSPCGDYGSSDWRR